jgi:hypothetical protein
MVDSFQKDQSPSPDGWSIDLCPGFYDFLEEDLIKVVEESRHSRQVPAAVNSTFIPLIPKKDDPCRIQSPFHYVILSIK